MQLNRHFLALTHRVQYVHVHTAVISVTCGLLRLCSEPHPSSNSTDLVDTAETKILITFINSMIHTTP